MLICWIVGLTLRFSVSGFTVLLLSLHHLFIYTFSLHLGVCNVCVQGRSQDFRDGGAKITVTRVQRAKILEPEITPTN